MTELEIYLITTVVGLSITVIGFLGKAFWEKSKKNQERIDESVVKTVSDNKEKIIALDKSLSLLTAKVAGHNEDIIELYALQKTANDNNARLIETINKFDLNSKVQHQEMKTVLENNTKALHEFINSNKK